MNYIILISSFLCWFIQSAIAECGTGNISEFVGLYEYSARGRTLQEQCTWKFNVTQDQDSILILNLQDFRTFRKGTKKNAYVSLPDGTRVHFTNKQRYLGQCIRFAPRGFQERECLEQLSRRYCSGPILEVNQWPPTLSSVSKTSLKVDDMYQYDMIFSFLHMTISCPKMDFLTGVGDEKPDYFIPTVAIASVLLLMIIIAVVVTMLLVKKTRIARRYAAEAKGKRSLPPSVALRNSSEFEQASSNNSSARSRRSQNETYLAPPYIDFDQPTVGESSTRHNYCQIDERKADSRHEPGRSFVVNRDSEIVENVLYNSISG